MIGMEKPNKIRCKIIILSVRLLMIHQILSNVGK